MPERFLLAAIVTCLLSLSVGGKGPTTVRLHPEQFTIEPPQGWYAFLEVYRRDRQQRPLWELQ